MIQLLFHWCQIMTTEEGIFGEVDVIKLILIDLTTFHEPTKEGLFPKMLQALIVIDSNFNTIECGTFYYRQPQDLIWSGTNVSCDCGVEYGLEGDGSMPGAVLNSYCNYPNEHQDYQLKNFRSEGMTLQCREGQDRVDKCDAPGSGGVWNRGNSHILLLVMLILIHVVEHNV